MKNTLTRYKVKMFAAERCLLFSEVVAEGKGCYNRAINVFKNTSLLPGAVASLLVRECYAWTDGYESLLSVTVIESNGDSDVVRTESKALVYEKQA